MRKSRISPIARISLSGTYEGRIRFFQSQIAFLISALEALYLDKNITESMTRKLGQRVATVLKFFGYKSLDTYKDIKRGYTIRSNYYHSNIVKLEKEIKKWQNPRKKIETISEQFFQFVRISILVFLELDKIQKSQKEEFLALIDESLLDEGKAIELKNKIDVLNTKSFI